MSHWASIVCDRWNRRNEWQARNGRTTAMTYFVPCPKCGSPNTKGVRCYGVAGERLQWIRLRRLDTCRCVLTPFEDASVIRSARMEGQPISADQTTRTTVPVE